MPQKSSPLPSIATVLNFSGSSGGSNSSSNFPGTSRPTGLPGSSNPSPPVTASAGVSVRKSTADGLPPISPNPFSMHMMNHNIPRVIAGEPDKECGIVPCGKDAVITPDTWSVYDVCQFLKINDCGAYCDSFSEKVRFSSLGNLSHLRC